MPAILVLDDSATMVMSLSRILKSAGYEVETASNGKEGMEVILKPLEGMLAKIAGYAGTALLGDGRVLLVLDLKELI